MGDVYRARDSRLDRVVALKVLHAGLSSDRDSLARFEREAKAASALNHPHIVNIYEIGDSSFGRFIAMEMVDGQTLRATMDSNDLRRILPVLINVADALAAAHTAGIVHRDLKPENILVTNDGYAKVVDFGLAKLATSRPSGGNASTTQWLRTERGVVMGTIGYMSPEQVHGKDVDHRSDVFSLGCVLYETVAGRQPFEGDSAVDTLHKILYDDPPPVSIGAAGAGELQRVIRRCLAKNADERYQSMKELAIELREIARAMSSTSAAAAVSPSRNRSRLKEIMVAAVLGALLVWTVAATRHPTAKDSQSPSMNVTRVTASGTAREVAIAPDGKVVAYVISEQGKERIRLTQLATGSDLEIVEGTALLGNIAFSPDGTYIYYTSLDEGCACQTLFRIAAFGGQPERLLFDVDDRPSFSPDGARMLFVRGDSVITSRTDGTAEHIILRDAPEYPVYYAPVWGDTPDQILVFRQRSKASLGLVSFDLTSRRFEEIGSAQWSAVSSAARAGNQRLLVAGRRDGSQSQLWLVSLPGGEVQRLTNDVTDYFTVTATSSGDSIAAINRRILTGITKAPLTSPDPPAELTPVSEARDGFWGLAWKPDGGLVFASLRHGVPQLWTSSFDGRSANPLSPQSFSRPTPCVSPDGMTVVLEAEGSQLAALRSGDAKATLLGLMGSRPTCSPVDDSIVYQNFNLHLVSLSAPAHPRTLTSVRCLHPTFSPDGTRIAYFQKTPDQFVGAVLSTSGQGAPRLFPQITPEWMHGLEFTGLRWAPDGKALLFKKSTAGISNIWSQPLDGSPAFPVTHFTEREIFAFEVSRDGRWLALSRGNASSDVILIRGLS